MLHLCARRIAFSVEIGAMFFARSFLPRCVGNGSKIIDECSRACVQSITDPLRKVQRSRKTSVAVAASRGALWRRASVAFRSSCEKFRLLTHINLKTTIRVHDAAGEMNGHEQLAYLRGSAGQYLPSRRRERLMASTGLLESKNAYSRSRQPASQSDRQTVSQSVVACLAQD